MSGTGKMMGRIPVVVEVVAAVRLIVVRAAVEHSSIQIPRKAQLVDSSQVHLLYPMRLKPQERRQKVRGQQLYY